MRRTWFCVLGALAALVPSRGAHAAEEADAEHPMSAHQVESWLDAPTTQADADTGDKDMSEAPPPPPRHHGFVVEAGVGALQHLGPLKHISPLSPWFNLQLGWEPTRWAMLFAETDLVFSNTSYARPPPQPRGYAMYGFGGGVRFTVKPTDRVGIHAQGSIGAARVSDDVLVSYGYRDTTTFNPYFGGLLGVEWYQVDPHIALTLHGGVRNYSNLLDRQIGGSSALAVIAGVALRYVF